MANAINLTTGEVALSRDPSLLLPPESWLLDPPSWHTVLATLGLEGASPDVLQDHVKVNATLDDVEARDASEVAAIQLAKAKESKMRDLGGRLGQVFRARRESTATEPTLAALVQAATTVAEVNAINLDDAGSLDYGAMVGDVLYLVLQSPGSALGAAGGWAKVPGATAVLANSIGKSFHDGGQSNRIVCSFDGRMELQANVFGQISLANGQFEVAIGKNGNAPTPAFQLGGGIVNGVTDQRLGLSIGGPLNVSNGDYFEVWMDVAGAGSQVTVTRMQFSAKRVA